MTMKRTERERLLHWYPPSWRDRYGDELLALMEDEWGDKTPSLRYRRHIARAGLRERLHATGLVGPGANAATRLRSGSLLVLSTWTLFVIAGLGLQKTSEHFARAVPLASRSTSQDAFNTVALFAVISLAAVLIGVAVTLPSAIRFLQSGGWPHVRRHTLRSVMVSGLAVATVIPLSVWAHTLNELQRNGADNAYSWAVTAWALLVALALASWTATAVAVVVRLNLSRRALRVEGTLAIVVTGSMAAVTVATAVWWSALSAQASWFLNGTPSGASSGGVSSTMVTIVSLMSIAVLFATVGVVRITGAWRDSSVVSSRPAARGSLKS
jgi:hypothetical protein